jgi:hypothetical protein
VKQILNTPIVQILEKDGEYQVIIAMSKGGFVEHEPFPKDLQGLVSAMQLATECLAGKFFPRAVVESEKFSSNLIAAPKKGAK